MKITIIMQRTNDNENDIVFRDGEFVKDTQINQICSDIYKLCEKSKLDIELVKRINKKYSLAVLYHPQKDDLGRVRPAIVVYQNALDKHVLKDSFDKFGLDYERFLALKKKKTTQTIRIFIIIIIGILGVATWIKNVF